MALRKEKIERFRVDLLERRALLRKDVSQATAQLLDDDMTYADSVDQSAADVERSFAVALQNRERDELRQIELALGRIIDGTYGVCETCEEPIAEARIKTFPFTTLCIDCKAELESEQGRLARGI